MSLNEHTPRKSSRKRQPTQKYAELGSGIAGLFDDEDYVETSTPSTSKKTSTPKSQESGKIKKKRTTKKKEPSVPVVKVDHDLPSMEQKQREMLDNMNEEQLRELLLKIIKARPGIMMTVMTEVQRPTVGYHPPPPSDPSASPQWCHCGRCREQPTEIENVCCLQPDCLGTTGEFRLLCLDKSVLMLQRRHVSEMFNLKMEDEDPKNTNSRENRSWRHAAYKQYILWQLGYLGPKDRRVIPSCCVWEIRDCFPDQFGQYTGFKPPS